MAIFKSYASIVDDQFHENAFPAPTKWGLDDDDYLAVKDPSPIRVVV